MTNFGPSTRGKKGDLVMKVIQTIILKVLLSKSDRILQNDT